MTSPPQQITLECPRCGERYEDWFRASLNLDLDDFSDEYVREATSATCPRCGHIVELDSLVVRDGIWRFGGDN